jgi:hypothetical protein
VQLTSLGNKDLEARHPTNPDRRRGYLPIHPSNVHPDLNVLLWLDAGLSLRKNSYVNIKDQHTVPIKALRGYEQENPHLRYVLNSSSYQTLIGFTDFTVPLESPPHHHAIVPPNAPRVPEPLLAPAERAALPREQYGIAGPVPIATRSPLLPTLELDTPRGNVAVSAQLHAFSYGTVATSRSTPAPPAARPSRHLPLPTPHNSRRDPNGADIWWTIMKTLAVLSIGSAIVGGVVFGLWKIWVIRMELLMLAGRGIRWSAVHAFRLGKVVVIASLKGLSWLFTQMVRGGKGLFRWVLNGVRG